MIRSFASSVADVTGSCVEPDVVGAFEGSTWGSEGIVGSAGGPRLRSGGGIGSGSGSGGGGGSGNWANASWPLANTVVPAASRSTSARRRHVEPRDVLAVVLHVLVVIVHLLLRSLAIGKRRFG